MKIASYIYTSNTSPADVSQLWIKPEDGGNATLHVFTNGKWVPLGGVGESAYEAAVKAGFEGSKEEWLDSLALKYSDLTAEQKADLVKDAVSAAERAAQAVENIENTINDIDVSSTDGAITALAAKQGLLENELTALGPKIDKVEKVVKTDSEKNVFYICDSNGKAIAKFDSTGLAVVAAKIKNANGDLTDLKTWLNGKVDAVSGKGLSTNDYTNADKTTLQGMQDIPEAVKATDATDVFYIADSNNNVIAQIDSDGIKTTALFVKDGNGNIKDILDIIQELAPSSSVDGILSDYYTSSFKISDKFGNVIFNVDSNGFEGISKMGGTHFLYKKNLVTLCDSLGAASQWQTRLAKITGAIYDKSKNDGRYSFGGTSTLTQSQLCAQDRAKVIAADGVTPDVIIIENVNDSGYMANVGSSEDVAFFKTSQTLLDVESQASSSAAETYWANNFSTIVGGLTPSVGKVLGVPFSQSNAVKLTINGAASASGEFTISLTNAGQQSISVNAGESVSSIVAKIYEYAWLNYVCTYSGNVVTFTPTSSSATPSITVNAGNTGITYSTATEQTGVNAIWRYFNSHDTSEWNNSAKWVSSISLWAAWKGLVEYLQGQFPRAYIYWLIPKTYNFDYTSITYKRADGSIDYDKVLAEKDYGKTLFAAQIAFCDYYQIPVIDIRKESGINPVNIATYCNVNNVHPKQDAYNRWADVIAKLL